ncbi:MAG TPA: helix-turn-helix domain-containing protein [Solirubrobacterales bacterium]|nr:helix-turn-helix domain-containing protein [Solirubrobacterales bacterium]
MPTNEPPAPRWRIRAPADLGRAISGARRSRGWTQERLARELGIKRSYVSELEAGASTLALERTLQALRRLGADVTVTLPDDGPPQ